MTDETPRIDWIKNELKDPWFEDGTRFLVALRVGPTGTDIFRWDYAVVVTSCDGDSMDLRTAEGGPYSDWLWDDFEYFALLEGNMPTEREES